VDTYTGTRPSTRYLERLLSGPHLIALAALKYSMVVGGLVAYELSSFKQTSWMHLPLPFILSWAPVRRYCTSISG
jgi:hypothetical protein